MSSTPSVPEAERRIGISCYATRSPGTGGRLRESPEDFQVEELLPRDEVPPGKGTASIIKVRTRDWDTLRLASRIAREFGISRHRVRYAGTKDKRAVCTRHFSVNVPLERAREIRIADVELLDAWTGPALVLGALDGNRFSITIASPGVPGEEAERLARTTLEELGRLGGFPNFFGPQRFGGTRATTHLVGRQLALGDLEEAVKVYIAHDDSEEKALLGSALEIDETNDVEDHDTEVPMETGPSPTSIARQAFARGEDLRKVLELFPRRATFERTLIQSLIEAPGDHPRALRSLPKGLVWMFVHALQSQLFNIALSRRLEQGIGPNEPQVGDLLLVKSPSGFESRLVPVETTNLAKVSEHARAGRLFVSGALPGPECPSAGGPQGEIESSVLREQGLDPKMFTIPGIPEASSKGSRRALLCPLAGVDARSSARGLLLEFRLPPGCYATVLTREIIKPSDADYPHTV
ncbi:MAG TPA: tRNA pseudouridine(13) synthase TruD [Thermoplasmata archaeon]|nr:tRNA pseudouridine(13) synthase TruD [Thermoplasmata archaeon]